MLGRKAELIFGRNISAPFSSTAMLRDDGEKLKKINR
jgi:hypothetical protein